MSRRSIVTIGAVTCLFGWGVAGWVGALIGMAIVVVGRANPAILTRRAAIAAAVLLAIAAFDTAAGPDSVSRSYANQRGLAHDAVSLAAVFIIAAVAGAIQRDRQDTEIPTTG